MKIIVLGTKGMLGSDVVEYLKVVKQEFANDKNPDKSEAIQLVCADSKEVDITNKPNIFHFITKHQPDVIINCAAFTNVDACEDKVDIAYSVNAMGVKNITLAAKECGAKVVQISTDYVFDGEDNESYTEDSPVNPLSIYGKSKLQAESYITSIVSDFIIIRTAWLYGKVGAKNYVKTMISLAKERNELKVVNDQIGSPTYTPDLAKAIWLLIKGNSNGIFHVTNSGFCSRFEWSKKIFEILGKEMKLIPVLSNEFPRPATVPPRAILNCKKYNLATGHKMRNWDEALIDYMKI